MKRGPRKFSHIQDEEFAEGDSEATSSSCCSCGATKCMPDEDGPGYVPGIIAIILVLVGTVGVILAAVLPGMLQKPEPPGPAPTPGGLPCNLTWPFPIEPAKWTDCPVFTNPSDSAQNVIFGPETIEALDKHFDIPFGATPILKAQCTTLRVPMDWDNSTLGWCSSIPIFIKSIYLDNIPQRMFAPTQLWWFPGGAGQPSSSLESAAAGLVKASNGSVEIYLMDRRGTGKSDFFDCPAALTDFAGCLSWAEDSMRQVRIKGQTITNTALDIVHAMNSVELAPKQRRVIMGTSQSSYYVQRFLRVAPQDFVDGAILDSVLPSDITKLPQAEAVANYVGLDVLTRCAQDPECASHFPEKNPMRTLYNIRLDYDNPEQSSCLVKLGMNPTEFSSRLAAMMYQPAMSLIPAVISRVARCNDADLAVLKNTWLKATAPKSLEGRPGSSVLAELANDWSEFWFVPGSAVDAARAAASSGCGWMQGVADSALFGSNLRPFSADGCARKERAKGALSYNPDSNWLKYPSTEVPILLMNGEFDSTIPTSWVRHAAAKLKTAGSTSVTQIEIPYAGHTPSNNSPTIYGGHCGMDLAFSFAVSTISQPTVACVDQVLPFNFANGTAEANAALLGTQDIWG